MATRLLAIAAFLPAISAFVDSFPVVAWSSHRSPYIDALSSLPPSAHRELCLDVLMQADGICEFDALILVEQPGLHASDLRSLSPYVTLSKRLKQAPHSVQLPYIRGLSSTSITGVAESLSKRCGAQLVRLRAGEDGMGLIPSSKLVVYMTLPQVDGQGSTRKDIMASHESSLAREILAVENAFPNHVFIYTGSYSSPYRKRHSITPIVEDVTVPSFSFAPDGANSTLPSGGILKRYQLLTPTLITSLLIVFFLIVPMIMMAVSALTSIQSPLRLDAPQGPSQEKKNQ